MTETCYGCGDEIAGGKDPVYGYWCHHCGGTGKPLTRRPQSWTPEEWRAVRDRIAGAPPAGAMQGHGGDWVED